jgi:hypothetical protein
LAANNHKRRKPKSEILKAEILKQKMDQPAKAERLKGGTGAAKRASFTNVGNKLTTTLAGFDFHFRILAFQHFSF